MTANVERLACFEQRIDPERSLAHGYQIQPRGDRRGARLVHPEAWPRYVERNERELGFPPQPLG